MVEFGGRPILWHIMKIYAGTGVDDSCLPRLQGLA
jgi:NDP-sugar pyrophosphorylase family protein